MRKYTVLGIGVVALATVLLSFVGNQQITAADRLAFSGTVDSGRTVIAMGDTNYEAEYGPGDWYKIYIPQDDTGWYCVTDGCQHFNRYWNGMLGQFVHFNVPQTGPCD